MPLYGDAHRPFPIRRSVTEPLQPVSEGGGVPRNQARPSLPELAGFPGITPNTVARAIEDLNRSGYRPLHPPGIAPLSSISVPTATRDAPGGDGDGGVIRRSPVEEAES
jgi:hypothetical protein